VARVHQVIHDQLRAPMEQVGERRFAVLGVEQAD